MAHDFDPAPPPALPDDLAAAGVPSAAVEVLQRVLDPSQGRSAQRDATASYEAVRRTAQEHDTGRQRQTGGRGRAVRGITSATGTLAQIWGGAGLLLAAVIMTVSVWPNATHQPSTTRTYAAADQLESITLHDGSQMILAPHTTLRLMENGRTSRSVDVVHGEVSFEVKSAADVPFSVQSGPVITQVLGTSFFVRRSELTRTTHVTVGAGKVRLVPRSSHVTGATLAQGQAADATDSTLKVYTVTDSPAGATWENGKLSFHDVPLSDVLTTLSKWYGYEFRMSDQSMRDKRVTIVVSTRSSAEALANLGLILGVNFTVVGDTVTMTPHPVQAPKKMSRVRAYDVWTQTREVGR